MLTDVIMPGMNGRELERRIRQDNPAVKCLFMSEYTAEIILYILFLEKGISFLQKPFTQSWNWRRRSGGSSVRKETGSMSLAGPGKKQDLPVEYQTV